tara:strand:- start:4596 stop:5603 length:1008 start_codon:yes stop_codon:yes gene_type:complete
MAILNDINAAVYEYVHSRVYDQTYKRNSALKFLVGENKELMPHGNNFGWLTQLGEVPTVGYITPDGTDVISNNTSNTLLRASLEYKTMYYNTVFTQDDFNKMGSSETEITSIAENKAAQTINSQVVKMSRDLYGSGFGATPKQFNGLTDIFSALGVAYGGITPVAGTNTSDWIATTDAAVGTINFAELQKMMANLRDNAGFWARGEENNTSEITPDIILSNAAVQSQFANTQQGQQVYNDETNLNAGFGTIFVNRVPWYTDNYCPGTSGVADNHLYILSKNSIRFGYVYGFDKPSPLSGSNVAFNQPLQNNVDYLVGNYFCVKRNSNGRFTAINA